MFHILGSRDNEESFIWRYSYIPNRCSSRKIYVGFRFQVDKFKVKKENYLLASFLAPSDKFLIMSTCSKYNTWDFLYLFKKRVWNCLKIAKWSATLVLFLDFSKNCPNAAITTFDHPAKVHSCKTSWFFPTHNNFKIRFLGPLSLRHWPWESPFCGIGQSRITGWPQHLMQTIQQKNVWCVGQIQMKKWISSKIYISFKMFICRQSIMTCYLKEQSIHLKKLHR